MAASKGDSAGESTTTTTPIDALAPQHADTLNVACAEVLALRAVAASFTVDADKKMKDVVKPLLAELGLTNSVAAPNFSLIYSRGRKSLKPEKLLSSVFTCKCEKCGEPTRTTVPMAVIEAASERGEPSWSLKGKDDPTENDKP